jgi:uncharacterized protein YqgC (DUF456 family)
MGVPRTLAIGLLGGLALGVVSRGWMRLVTADPEFTWSGTIGILAGFAFFGLAQAVVVAIRRRTTRRAARRAARVVGVLGIVPLLGAAGGPLVPTLVLTSLAIARRDWSRAIRIGLAVVAWALFALLVSTGVDETGWTVAVVVGVLAMAATYVALAWAASPTFAPRPQLS